MDDSWTGLALPFGMIGLWVLFGIAEVFRTPDHTKHPDYRPRGDANLANPANPANPANAYRPVRA